MSYYLSIYKKLSNYNKVGGWLLNGRIRKFLGQIRVRFKCPLPYYLS